MVPFQPEVQLLRIQNPEVKDLKVREWMCPCCGAVHDRDANAKDNIAGEGIRILKENGIRIFV